MHWWKTTMQVLAVMAALLVVLILATVWMRLLHTAFPNEPVVVKVELPETEKETTPVNTGEAEDSHREKSEMKSGAGKVGEEDPPYFGEDTEDLYEPPKNYGPGSWRH